MGDIAVQATASESYDYTHSNPTSKALEVSLKKPFDNGEASGTYSWLNGAATSHAQAAFTNYFNSARLQTNGAVDYDYSSKAINGVFKAVIDQFQLAGFNAGLFTEFSTAFDNDYEGSVGAFLESALRQTKATITANGNLRGGVKNINSTVITFDHQISPPTHLHLEVTLFPSGNFEFDGNLRTIVGNANLTVFFKCDKEGNFSISL